MEDPSTPHRFASAVLGQDKAFANLQKPVLDNLREDIVGTTKVAADNPDSVRELSKLASTTRMELGEIMQRGASQRPTVSVHPIVAAISHEKDWGKLES